MPKRGIVIASAIAAVLVVGGGTATAIALAGQAGEAPETIAASEQPTSETPAPLVAETEAPLTAEEADAQFLEFVRGDLPIDTSIPNATDEQLIAGGHEACKQLLAGVDSESIRLVEGEEPVNGYYMDSASMITGGRYFYCPETIETLEEAEKRAQEEAGSGDNAVELP